MFYNVFILRQWIYEVIFDIHSCDMIVTMSIYKYISDTISRFITSLIKYFITHRPMRTNRVISHNYDDSVTYKDKL